MDRNGASNSALYVESVSPVCRFPHGVYFNSEFTVFVWVYVNFTDYSTRSVVHLVEFGNGIINAILSTAQFNDNIFLALNYLGVGDSYLAVFTLAENKVVFQLISKIGLANEKWTHLEATFNGTSAKLYMNGVISSEANVQFYLPRNVTRTYNILGQTFDISGSIKLDEIAIYNQALNDSLVKELLILKSHIKCCFWQNKLEK